MKSKKKKVVPDKKIKLSLSLEELQRLVNACDTLEDKALIELAVTTGIRREDIVNIDKMNVDLDAKIIRFWEKKKGRFWSVVLEPTVIQTLRLYMKDIPSNKRFLFNFSGRTAYNKLQKLMEKAGIKKHLEFHGLRRTFIRLSKKLGREVRYVMEQTGDTARVIIDEYEGYTIDEMIEITESNTILKSFDINKK